ncbi:hypothetical protein BJ742DRAFT_419476 [Cladochytrium replicatum]|nr:hypothetical protein BJ742DRAFT_419476 [Cladochytrium replicatum]
MARDVGRHVGVECGRYFFEGTGAARSKPHLRTPWRRRVKLNGLLLEHAAGTGSVTASQRESNETTRLLQPTYETTESIHSHDTATVKSHRDVEHLGRIVRKTADNLIDISAIRLLDKIQTDELTDRTKEFSDVLSTMQPPLQQIVAQVAMPKFAPVTHHHENVRSIAQILANGNSVVTSQDAAAVIDALGKMKVSVAEIKLDHQVGGDVVVRLTS